MQDRRLFLQHIGYGALFVACGGDKSTVQPDASDPNVDAAPNQWASGGTAAMTDKATYPDPFAMPATMCSLVASTTLGPCTTATDLVREDISEGLSGLPMRLAIKVVTTSCTPLVGATVKVWHTNISGSYSGMTPAPSQCLADNAHASKDFFRGVATTNAQGVVFFDTCY